jgi:hypothetical protein
VVAMGEGTEAEVETARAQAATVRLPETPARMRATTADRPPTTPALATMAILIRILLLARLQQLLRPPQSVSRMTWRTLPRSRRLTR